MRFSVRRGCRQREPLQSAAGQNLSCLAPKPSADLEHLAPIRCPLGRTSENVPLPVNPLTVTVTHRRSGAANLSVEARPEGGIGRRLPRWLDRYARPVPEPQRLGDGLAWHNNGSGFQSRNPWTARADACFHATPGRSTQAGPNRPAASQTQGATIIRPNTGRKRRFARTTMGFNSVSLHNFAVR